MKGGYGWFSGLENTVMQVIDILFYKRSFYVLFPHAFVFTERKTETITQTKFSMQYLLLASFLKVFSHVHLAINIDFTIPQLLVLAVVHLPLKLISWYVCYHWNNKNTNSILKTGNTRGKNKMCELGDVLKTETTFLFQLLKLHIVNNVGIHPVKINLWWRAIIDYNVYDSPSTSAAPRFNF